MSELTEVIDGLAGELEQCRADKADLLAMLRKVQRNRWDYPELNALLDRFPQHDAKG